jgi:hypothetical protein
MPTFPRSPLSAGRRVFPSTAGRLAFQAGPTRYVRQVKPAPGMPCPTSGLSSPFVHFVAIGCPVLSRAADSIMHRHKAEYSVHPRGPRSGPGYIVPIHHHLIDLIRPTRRHIAISPHGGLYAMPSLCGSAEATREWIRAFAGHSVLTCRPLRPRGVRRRSVPGSDVDVGLRRVLTGSALPKFPQSVSRGGSISWLQWFAHCYGLPACLPP